MSALECMRPFFRLCQVVAMYPFRMEFDEHPPRRFRQFTFSWRCAITWWFGFFALDQLVVYTCILRSAITSSELANLPSIVYFSLITSIVIYCLMLMSTRFWVAVRLNTLRSAIGIMQEIEQGLQKYAQCKSSVKFRIAIGISISILWMLLILTLPFRVVYTSSVKDLGPVFTWINLFLGAVMMTTVGCAFIFLHLVYYVMGYYIRTLSRYLDDASSSKCVDTTKFLGWIFDAEKAKRISIEPNKNIINSQEKADQEHLEALRHCRRIFELICEATAKWNSIFELPALSIVSTKVVTAALSTFSFIQAILVPASYLAMVKWFMFASALLDIFMMAIVFHAADTPVREAVRLRKKLFRASSKRLLWQPSTNEAVQTLSFLGEISEDRLRLSTVFFNIGMHLVPALIGSIVTYLVILLQMHR